MIYVESPEYIYRHAIYIELLYLKGINFMSSSLCPNCSKDIGFLAVFKATLPTMIKCPSCKTAVAYKPFPWLIVIVLVSLYATLLYFSFTELTQFISGFISREFLARVFAAIGLWVPFELGITICLRKMCTLQLK